MALDYSQKRQVNRNRPRRRPVKLIVVGVFAAMLGTYGMGVATGWLLFHQPEQPSAATTAPAQGTTAAAANQGQSTAGVAQNQQSGTRPPTEPDLTFYYTLPKGENAVMGSGINRSADRLISAKPSATEKAEVKPAAEARATRPAASTTITVEKVHFSVQIAAYHDRKEAEALKVQFAENGFSTRIEEYAVPGKGTWYRVRVGHRMERDSAERLATKLGSGALAVPE